MHIRAKEGDAMRSSAEVNKQIADQLAAFKKEHKALSKKTLLNILFYQLIKIQALERLNGKEQNSMQLSPSQDLENKDQPL